MNATPSTNGHAPTPQSIEERLLGEPLSTGYQASIPWAVGPSGTFYPLFQLRANIEQMLWHPMVSTALEYYKSGVAGAEFWGGQDPNNPEDTKGLPICDDPVVATFCKEQCERFWDWGVPNLQEGGYPYGWGAGENLFEKRNDIIRWHGLAPFAPQDTYVLTQNRVPVGVRVKNIIEKGEIDLWMVSGHIPAKALWYAHNPRYGNHYGRSQLLGAWLPWRRAAWKDGAEMNVDMAVYRFAFPGIMVRYPQEDLQAQANQPYATADNQNNLRRSARDVAKQMGDQFKAGATVGLPSSKYPAEMGGHFKWEFEIPKQTIDVKNLDAHIKTLYDQISHGIGVPPELLQAAETGSGYSGRMIPVEAFLDAQQKIGDRFLDLFVKQVLAPLVKWNFGDVPFEIKLKRLLDTKNKNVQKFEQTVKHESGAKEPRMDGSDKEMDGQFSHRKMIAARIREVAREALRRVA